ncbi:Glutamine-hydrolyzing GMP synthase [Candidatus Kinetoplastibacterium sorsogonicusi]|uniref:GMP synthase [glutamine-hydrolyzing] n=1 Tax=Candidatus Kinetoplastidibacterium kentomonadis TaxID=1576550 RepID=A0A3Q8EUA0_9PROT|nr:Glutamine-hydrolyzing GMP synthase [Candidatus Kinetoplastibacterium sorsogonicusi]
MKSNILIIDYGSQFTQLIARRVRELGVYSIVYNGKNIDENSLLDYINNNYVKGIILSGSHESTYNKHSNNISEMILNHGIPVLGICYGMQSIIQTLGGKVISSMHKEFGCTKIDIKNSILFKNLDEIDYTSAGNHQLEVLMSHGDKVTEIPDNFEIIASSKNCPIAAIEDSKRNIYGLQFHPEVTDTISGKQILNNFIKIICKCKESWNIYDFLDKKINDIQKQIGNDEVILGLSGGVDSSVVAALLHKAIGNRLTCIFVDHGMLRLNEAKNVNKIFSKMNIKVLYIDASNQFLKKLANIQDPETKRLIIGKEFIEVFQKEA